MIRSADQLYAQYGHYFDYELINGSLEFAFRELCDVVHRMSYEPQWVPHAWCNDANGNQR